MPPVLKSYEIVLKDEEHVPRAMTVARLNITFKRGQRRMTQNLEEVRYAKMRPALFGVRVLSAPAAPVPPPVFESLSEEDEMELEDAVVAEGEDMAEVEEVEEVDESKSIEKAREAWLDLTGDGTPKNEEIIAYAEFFNIDLDGATRKADMLDNIELYLDKN